MIKKNQFYIFLLLTIFLTVIPNIVYANDPEPIEKSESVVVTTEKISSEEDEKERVNVYKTKILKTTETTIKESDIQTTLEVRPAPEEKTHRTSLYDEYELMIITPKRIPTEKKRVSENMTVITAEDIKKLPVRDLTEILTLTSGIDVQLNGQFGQSTALSINGSQARQVLLMVDGIPFNTQLSGQANPTQIPIEHIKQIEIIKGGASSAWGSSLGGVVNVITKDVGDTDTPKGNITTSFAEFETTRESFDVAGKLGKGGYFFSGSYFDTDGTLSESDVTEKKAFGKLLLPLGENAKVVGSFGYHGADVSYGVNPSGTTTAQPYYTRYGQILFDVAHDDYQFNIAYKYNNQDITTDIYTASTNVLISSTVSSNVYHGLSFNGSMEPFQDHTFVVGSDFSWHTLKSNNFLDSSKSINIKAPYANYTIAWNNWDFISGVRYDNNQHFGNQTSPSFGMVYHFEDPHESTIRTKVSRAFNAPPLLWIFNNDPSLFVGANPDLRPEKATLYEAGLNTKISPNLEAELSYYRTDVRDAIALVFDSTNFVFVQQNFPKFLRQGGELLLNYKLNESLSLYGSGAFNDVENRTTKVTVRNQGIARQRFRFGARYKSDNGLGINLSGYYNRWSASPDLKPNDRKPIFDAKITKKFKNINDHFDIETFLNIHNITNSKYFSSITFPLPERYFEGGLTILF